MRYSNKASLFHLFHFILEEREYPAWRLSLTQRGTEFKGVQGPAALTIVCFRSCEFQAVSYSGSSADRVADFAQSMLKVTTIMNQGVVEISKVLAEKEVSKPVI